MTGTGKHRSFWNKTIADWLLITPEEAEQLEGWPAASWYPQLPVLTITRTMKTEARRKMITVIVAELRGKVPSTRKMQPLLAERGFTASPPTIAKDYAALFGSPVGPRTGGFVGAV